MATRLRSSLSRQEPLSGNSEDSSEMSSQLASPKTQTARNRSPKGFSGSPFKSNLNKISWSVHSSDASFGGQSLISAKHDSLGNTIYSEQDYLPNAVEGTSGLYVTDPTQSFHDRSGLVVPPRNTGDSLGGPATVTSSPKGDTVPKTNQSQRDSSSNIDQSQQLIVESEHYC